MPDESKSLPDAAELLDTVRDLGHDMSQPIQTILGLSELLLSETPPGSAQYEDLASIVSQAKRLVRIKTQISHLAHTGQLPPEE